MRKFFNLKKYYFTFPKYLVHPETGTLMHRWWVEIKAKSMEAAMKKVTELYGDDWAIHYSDSDSELKNNKFFHGCYEVYTVKD